MGLRFPIRSIANLSLTILTMLTLLPSARAQPWSSVKLTWSLPAVSTTPEKNIEFHGPFCSEDLTVSCENLGAHDFLEISFDLLVMASWDGSCTTLADGTLDRIGPDYFRLGIQNGPTLMYHTFSNIPLVNPTRGWGFPNAASKSQSYPSQVPGVRLPSHTGAKEFNTLGYTYPDPAPVVVPMDTTYAIHFIVPHRDAAAVLELNGLHLQNAHDENWGIANLVVRPVGASQVSRPTPDQIAAAFGALLDPRADQYIPAFQTLISGMDTTADWIERNVRAVPTDRRVNELVGRVLTGGLAERVAAGAELRKIGALVEPDLRDARRVAKPEALQEIDLELESLGITPIADEGVRRVIVATRALEVIGTTRALTVRTLLTTGLGAVQPDAPVLAAPATAAQPTTRPWDMHFGDATLTLVGISEFSNEPQQAAWWAPDGSPTVAPPVTTNIRRGPVAADNSIRRSIAVVFRATGPKIKNPRVMPFPTMPSGGSSIDANGQGDGYFLFSFLAATPNQTGNIRVLFANGEPAHQAAYRFDPATSTVTPISQDPEFELLTVRQINPQILGVTFNPPASVATLDWDVALITADGKTLIHESQNGQGQFRGLGMLYHYRTSADQIRQIVYDSRPWQAMEIRDVSLYPGQHTRPIVASSPAPTPSRAGGMR